MTPSFTIIGRSSSHFTRVARIFALELEVAHAFVPVSDLRSLSASDYGQNPSLRMPVLRADNDEWFGALNICRTLHRMAKRERRVIWPEQLTTPLLANAQELTLQAMATGVELIMSRDTPTAGSAYATKRRASLENSLHWLEARIDAALSTLPARDLSYLEVTLYSLTRHLTFRDLVETASFPRLRAFCEVFEARPSAVATPFVFD
jgi:glutathione S-transferase